MHQHTPRWLGGDAFCTLGDAGMRELSIEEWNGTPTEYLLHPDHHPVLFSRIPGESTVEDKREKLFHKHGQQDYNPSHPHEGAGHGHH